MEDPESIAGPIKLVTGVVSEVETEGESVSVGMAWSWSVSIRSLKMVNGARSGRCICMLAHKLELAEKENY
ncbi:hypothetical protein SESBI_15630 [Sesbania bispinosa]|nr:hypothetical protein SESBI_15630 [Sesbania bispinosa]